MIYSTVTFFDADLNQIEWRFGDFVFGRSQEARYRVGREWDIAMDAYRSFYNHYRMNSTPDYIDVQVEARDDATHELIGILVNRTFKVTNKLSGWVEVADFDPNLPVRTLAQLLAES